MASIFAHGFTAYAFGKSFSKEIYTKKLWILGIICSILPDADVIGFKFGITYESFWGHRGFSHSLLFALLLGIIVTFIFYSKKNIYQNRSCTNLIFYHLHGFSWSS